MRLFTYMDFVNEACRTDEIDMVWSPRWSRPDAISGLCDPEQVGKPKESNAPLVDTVPPDEPWTGSVLERELAAYHANPVVYRGTSASNLNKLLDYELRLMEKKAPEPIITDQNINSFTTEELNLYLFRQLTAQVQIDVVSRLMEEVKAG